METVALVEISAKVAFVLKDDGNWTKPDKDVLVLRLLTSAELDLVTGFIWVAQLAIIKAIIIGCKSIGHNIAAFIAVAFANTYGDGVCIFTAIIVGAGYDKSCSGDGPCHWIGNGNIIKVLAWLPQVPRPSGYTQLAKIIWTVNIIGLSSPDHRQWRYPDGGRQ